MNHITDPLLTAIRETAASTGWEDAALVIDVTAERLAGPRATDDALEETRARLWQTWNRDVEISGAC